MTIIFLTYKISLNVCLQVCWVWDYHYFPTEVNKTFTEIHCYVYILLESSQSSETNVTLDFSCIVYNCKKKCILEMVLGYIL